MRLLSPSVLSSHRPVVSSATSSVTTSSALGMAKNPTTSVFLTPSLAKACIDAAGGSPVYAYSLAKLEETADKCLAFPNAYRSDSPICGQGESQCIDIEILFQ
jgi:hypothetical protein